MNTEPNRNAGESPADKIAKLDVSAASAPLEVPVFNCVVHVSHAADGGVRARVANLADLDCAAGSEREALSKIVPAFKQRVVEFIERGAPIPWVDPPDAARAEEQTRFIPVHL